MRGGFLQAHQAALARLARRAPQLGLGALQGPVALLQGPPSVVPGARALPVGQLRHGGLLVGRQKSFRGRPRPLVPERLWKVARPERIPVAALRVDAVGIDLGIKEFLTTSEGELVEA